MLCDLLKLSDVACVTWHARQLEDGRVAEFIHHCCGYGAIPMRSSSLSRILQGGAKCKVDQGRKEQGRIGR